MLNRIGKFFVVALITWSSLHSQQRMYIDENELDYGEDSFKIHIGGNFWIETDTIHRDETGLYAFEERIFSLPGKQEYQKKWKCPYCHQYWPVGKACQNKDCPSKYKDKKHEH